MCHAQIPKRATFWYYDFTVVVATDTPQSVLDAGGIILVTESGFYRTQESRGMRCEELNKNNNLVEVNIFWFCLTGDEHLCTNTVVFQVRLV